jgi:hypothetical protein
MCTLSTSHDRHDVRRGGVGAVGEPAPFEAREVLEIGRERRRGELGVIREQQPDRQLRPRGFLQRDPVLPKEQRGELQHEREPGERDGEAEQRGCARSSPETRSSSSHGPRAAQARQCLLGFIRRKLRVTRGRRKH